MTAKTLKRFRIGEISGVDRPAQPLAEALIMKSQGTPPIQDLVANAKAIELQGPVAATFSSAQFESGMLDLAKSEAQRKGTTPETELANGWSQPHSDLCLLGRVWSVTNTAEYRPRH